MAELLIAEIDEISRHPDVKDHIVVVTKQGVEIVLPVNVTLSFVGTTARVTFRG